MNEFIATCPFEGPGARAEEIVWEKLKEALKEDEVLAYYQYPLFVGSEECKRQPDILIFHRQWGIMIIEVKGLEMKQIKKVRGGQWEVKGYFDKPYINPGKQAEKQLEVLMKKFTDRKLVGKIPVKIAVAVPYIEKKEWVGKGVVLEDQPLLFKDEMGPKTLKQWLRGIAGSGKTILLCQRAVHMHLKHPDGNLQILHSWGGTPEPCHDAILIDEGQDLVAPETYKYEGKQPFYWMAYKSIRTIIEMGT